MRKSSADFDNWYRSHPDYYSRPSDGLIKCIEDYQIDPCNALDLGCGQGRNALWLASKGFQVVAVDNSSVAIQTLKRAAEAQGLRIDAQLADIHSFHFGSRRFGLEVILTTLNHLEPDYVPSCCDKIVESLANGGIVYCVSFTTEDPGFKGDSEKSSECTHFVKHYFSPGELGQLFSNIEILEYREYIKLDDSHGAIHYHGKVKLVGRKHD